MRSKIITSVIIITLLLLSIPQIFHKNKGESISSGEYNSGSLKNAYLLPLKNKNWKCYSWLSYFILGREYVNSKLYRTIDQTYSQLSKQYPKRMFIYMESARKKGGRLFPHRTHQTGLSIDFMSPLIKNGEPKYFNAYGIFRYALNFDKDGRLISDTDVTIDFDILANHILLLDKNARKNGLRIKKVIFKIDLKDNLFKTETGQQLKNSDIYFAQNLTPTLNKLHDDHYHVDFEIIGH
jgi:penicillin-insensitive murein endopeptidase